MKQAFPATLKQVAALALVVGSSAALAHGDPTTHGHGNTGATLAASLVTALFIGAVLRLAWLVVAALRRRLNASRAASSGGRA